MQNSATGASIKAALTAGMIFLVLEFIFAPLFLGQSSWTFLNKAGEMVMGAKGLTPGSFDYSVIFVGLIIHFTLSLIFAMILVPMIISQNRFYSLIISSVFAFSLYIFNYYLLSSSFPWFIESRNWLSLLCHLSFGWTVSLLISKSKRDKYPSRYIVHDEERIFK